jgi:RNA polymerase sigma factor (sigma-70 family)
MNKLTPREREIIPLIVEGYSNPEIARILHLSPWTVQQYVKYILEKLYLRNRVQLAAYAVRNFDL